MPPKKRAKNFARLQGDTEDEPLQEIDVTQFSPRALLGIQVEVFWPEDGGFYSGEVTEFDRKTWKHTVLYALDSSVEKLHLAITRVRMRESDAREMAPASPNDFVLMGKALRVEAGSMQKRKEDAAQVKIYREKAKELLQRVTAKRPTAMAGGGALAGRGPQADGSGAGGGSSGAGAAEAKGSGGRCDAAEPAADLGEADRVGHVKEDGEPGGGSFDGEETTPGAVDKTKEEGSGSACRERAAVGDSEEGELEQGAETPRTPSAAASAAALAALSASGSELSTAALTGAFRDHHAEGAGCREGPGADASMSAAGPPGLAVASPADGLKTQPPTAKSCGSRPTTPPIGMPASCGRTQDGRRYHRVDTVFIKPEALLEHRVMVFWVADKRWYCGKVTKFDPKTYMHTIHYTDGERENLLLSTQNVRVLISKNHSFPEASRDELRQQATVLRAAIKGGKVRLSNDAMKELSADLLRGLLEMVESKANLVPEVDAAAAVPRAPKAEPRTYSEKKGAVAGGSASGKAAAVARSPEQNEDEIEKRLLEGRRFADEDAAPHWREIDLSAAAPGPLIGRKVAVHWGIDNGFYEAMVAGQEGLHHVLLYEDDVRETSLLAMDRIRVLMYPREVFPLAPASHLRLVLSELERTVHGWKQTIESMGTRHVDENVTDGRSLTEVEARIQRLSVLLESMEAEEVEGSKAAADGGEAETCRGRNVVIGSAMVRFRYALEGSAAERRPVEGVGTAAGSAVQGEICWAKLRGFRWWPALVSTFDEALAGTCATQARQYSAKRERHIPVHFFGSYEYAILDASQVMSLEDGVRRGFHRRPARADLKRGIREAVSYLSDSMLPPDMDVQYGEDSDEEVEEGEDAGSDLETPKKGRTGKGSRGPLQADSLPFKVSQHLEVECLGEIEYINPSYHCKVAIWPVGYRATRITTSPAGRLPHTMEILRGEGLGGGEGPIFKITPEGEQPVQGRSMIEAWVNLFSGAEVSRRSFNSVKMLGLNYPPVVAAIQALPGAAKCANYCWRGGDRPEPPPLTQEEEDMRLAIKTSLQCLPPGIQKVHAERLHQQASCHACGMVEEFDDDYMLQCDSCRMTVHMNCYGVSEYHNGKLWLCDVCRLPGLKRPPPCMLCPVEGGAMKLTDSGRWCHLACARWISELCIDPSKPVAITNTDKISSARGKLTCVLCKQPYGACIQCNADPKCYTSFHVLCAANAGLYLAVRERRPAQGGAPPPPAAGAAAQEEQSELEHLHYCPRHSRLAIATQTGDKQGTELVGWRSPCGGTSKKRPRFMLNMERSFDLGIEMRDYQSDPRLYAPPVCSGGCARGTPYNPMHRRGLREPDVLEAQCSKREYVAQLPLVVTGRTGPPIQPPPARSTARYPSSHRGTRARDGAAGGGAEGGADALRPGADVQSAAERLARLREYVPRAVAPGKSAIHGWGAFCKVPHRRGASPPRTRPGSSPSCRRYGC